jgi:hypothetical protein
VHIYVGSSTVVRPDGLRATCGPRLLLYLFKAGGVNSDLIRVFNPALRCSVDSLTLIGRWLIPKFVHKGKELWMN